MKTSRLVMVTLAVMGLFAGPSLAQAPVEDPIHAQQTSTIVGVNHVGLSVVDLEQSAKFYRDTMGLQTVQTASKIDPLLRSAGLAGQMDGRSATLVGPNSFLKLMEFEGRQAGIAGAVMPVQGPGITHICFQAPKSKPLDGKAVQNGATWVSSGNAMVDLRGVGFMYGYLRDPSGLMFEVEHAPEPKFDVDVWMGHVAIATHDLTSALAFYEKVLGMKPYRRVDNISGPTFDLVGGVENAKIHGAWFRVAPFYNLEFWEYVNPKTAASNGPTPLDKIGYNVVALESTDIEADFARLNAGGIPLETGIVSVDGGRSIFLRDLDGNLLSLTEFEAGSSLSLTSLGAK